MEGRVSVSDNSEAWRDRQRTVLAGLRGDVSQEEASRLLGVKYWRWVHLEQAKVKLSPEEFWLLADAFGVTPFDLARRLGYPSEHAASTFAERLRFHGAPDEAIRELLSDVDGRTLHPEAAEALARRVAEDEREHPRRIENRRRANGS